MNYLNFKRNKFYTFLKNKLYTSLRKINLKQYNINNLKKYLNLKSLKLDKVYKLVNIKSYNWTPIYKFFKVKSRKKIFIYTFGSIVFSTIVYLNIPIFYNYNNSNFENQICEKSKIKCSIIGKISYRAFPSPRLKFKDFVIKDSKNNIIGKFKNLESNISILNLVNKKKFLIQKLKLQKYEIDIELNNLKKYEDFFTKKINLKKINLNNGTINFIDNKKLITKISNTNFKYKKNSKNYKIFLKGNFIGDEVNFTFENNDNSKPSKVMRFKLINMGLSSKVEINNGNFKSGIYDNNFFFKKGKERLNAIFDYKKSEIKIKKSSLRSSLFDGNLNGDISFLPHFKFDLNFDLNTVNFNKIHSFLVDLSPNDRKTLYKINEKINGQATISVDKIFSKRTLINSLESQVDFVNGDILINKALFNLGKLGAADLNGIIKNGENFTNFKFENNIYVDNLKNFYNKFGIYNKKKVPYSLSSAGSFDLKNLVLHLSEISDTNNFTEESILYYEKEFNNIILENGYESLFNFGKLKEFIKSTTPEDK